MKRLCLILLFLLLGAIINVAVAWGCVILLADQTDNWGLIRVGVAQLANDDAWTVLRVDRQGYFRIESRAGFKVDSWDERWLEPTSLIESWSRVPDPNELPGTMRKWQEFAAGWPCVSLWSRLNELDRFDLQRQPGFPRSVLSARSDRGWLVDWPILPQRYILPTGPLWTGIVINTVFYAVLLWGLAIGPGRIRGLIRRRRGLCERCAYDLRGADHAACPECGTELCRARRKEVA